MISEGRSAGITLANLRGRLTTILFVPLGCTGAVVVAFDRPSWAKHAPVFAVVAYLAVVAIASIWLLYRGCRMGVRFDDHGVTVRKFLRTYRFGWPQVSRFEDAVVWSPGDGHEWALAVVLRDGQIVTTRVLTMSAGWRTKPAILETVAAIQSAATQHGIPAGRLTGQIGPMVELSDE
jgi:Bacterial PH domain